MLQIGNKYIRTSPSGDTSEVHIKNQGEKEYHTALEQEGFVYTEESIRTKNVCTACES